MKRQRYALIPLVFLTAALGHVFAPRPSEACSYGEPEPVDVNVEVADGSPAAFARGRLPLLQPHYAPYLLVVAYRWLSGLPLDEAEQRSALSGPSLDSTGVATESWRRARAAAIGDPGPSVSSGWVQSSYDGAANCLENSFVRAAQTLEARVREHGVSSEVRDWIAAQDIVFSNCEFRTPPFTPFLPNPAPQGAAAWLVKDRDYQIAASHFYGASYDEAGRRFLAIAQDSSSPWAPWGVYLAARSRTRLGDLSGALALLSTVTADAAISPTSLANYRSHVAIRENPGREHDAIAQRLSATHLGDDFGRTLTDYVLTLDAQGSGNELSRFIGNLADDRPEAYIAARDDYNAQHTLPWLVAALMHAQGTSQGVAALLRAAEQVPENSAASITLSYHRARILLEQGHRARAFALATHLLEQLRPEDGPSTVNAVHILAFQAAPSLDASLAHAFSTAVSPVYEDTSQPFAWSSVRESTSAFSFDRLHSEAGRVLAFALPMSRLRVVVDSARVPDEVRPQLTAVSYVRATLLEHAQRHALSERAVAQIPRLAPYVEAIESSSSSELRRLALVYMLLKFPSLDFSARAHHPGAVLDGEMNTMYGRYGWCALPAEVAEPPAYLNTRERTQLASELQTLRTVGSSPTFFARESVRLARIFPNDPRIPEILHLAVRAGRYGCRDDYSAQAGATAFRHLHRHYPNSPFTARTPYHY